MWGLPYGICSASAPRISAPRRSPKRRPSLPDVVETRVSHAAEPGTGQGYLSASRSSRWALAEGSRNQGDHGGSIEQ